MKLSCIIFCALGFCILSCKNDVAPSAEVVQEEVVQKAEPQISWIQNDKRYSVDKAYASLIKKPSGQILSITAKSEEIGIVLQTYSKDGEFGTQQLDQELIQSGEYNSLKIYVSVDQYLSIFISERCRPSEGFIYIDKLDLENRLVSGRFIGKVCKGSTERLKDSFQTVTQGEFKDLPLGIIDQ